MRVYGFMNAPFAAHYSNLEKEIAAFFVPTVMFHALRYKRVTMGVVITKLY